MLFVLAVIAASAVAVGPKQWRHSSADDFRAGTSSGVVVTNFGDVRLARELKTVGIEHPDVSAVYCLHALPDGRVFAGTGPSGTLLQVQPGGAKQVAAVGEGVQVFALSSDREGRLLIAASGERGRLLRLDGEGKTNELFASDEDVYIWSVHVEQDGKVLLATGPNGRLLEIDPKTGGSKVLFDCDEANLLSMAVDADGNVLVGTDPGGLVYRVNRQTGRAFALFDAPESEIGAIVVGKDGTIYLATSQAVPGEDGESPATEGVGRPGAGMTVPLPMPEHPTPKPPEVPEPPQILPDPIPRRAPATKPAAAGLPSEDLLGLVAFRDVADNEASSETPTPTQPAVTGDTSGGKPRSPTPAEVPSNGNAVYRIDRAGFTRELWRGDAVVLAMVWNQDHLLLATGNDGTIYQLKPGDDEVAPLVRTDSQQASALWVMPDGQVLVGLSNPPAMGTLGAGLAKEGTYTSPPLDAAQVALFGRVRLVGSLPPGSSLDVQTRSGNVSDPQALGWSDWSPPKPAAQFVPIDSAGARFFQYRLTLRGDGIVSPQVEEVEVSYQVPNQPPAVKAIVVGEPDRAEKGAVRTVSWEATDPNDDALRYSVWLRGSPTGPWVLLKDRLTEPTWDWDTRTVADGRYRLKIVASDELANPLGEGRSAERVSESLLVDNEPPVIGDLKSERRGKELQVALRILDRTGSVASLEYTLAGRDDWQKVFPTDMINDSPEERYDFVVTLPGEGEGVLSLRATDVAGNTSYQTIEVPAAP
jgi:hypothetical protein